MIFVTIGSMFPFDRLIRVMDGWAEAAGVGQGEIMAQATSWDDELIVAECDLEMCRLGRTTIFDFATHRRTEAYGRIVEQTGSVAPPAWTPARRAAE